MAHYIPENYPNQIELFRMTEADARNQITELDYPTIKTKHDLTESEMYILPKKDRLYIKPFMPVMIQFIIDNHKFPTPHEFIRKYFDESVTTLNKEMFRKYFTKEMALYFKTETLPGRGDTREYKREIAELWMNTQNPNIEEYVYKEIINGIGGRIRRSLPSLYRDPHFCLFMKELYPKSNIKYNIDMDLENDVDCMIEINGDFYAVCLFVETNGGMSHREMKENRHDRFDNVTYIDFNVPMTEEYKNNHYYLATEELIREKFNKIIKELELF